MHAPALSKIASDKVIGLIPDTIDALRLRGKEALLALGLPNTRHEEYRFTGITRALEKSFETLAPVQGDQQVDLSVLPLSSLDAYRVVFVNGQFVNNQSVLPAIKGVSIGSLNEALKNHPAEVQKHLGTISEPSSDGYVAWNTAAWTDGLYLNLENNIQLDKPVVVYHILTGAGVAIQRNLIVTGKSSEATLLHVHHSVSDGAHFLSMVSEGSVNENAGLHIYELQTGNAQHHLHHHSRIIQTNNSRVNTYTFSFDGAVIRNNMQLVLDGEGCESHMYGLYLLGNDTQVDNHTVVDHRKPNAFSNEFYKGILDAKSKGVFNGKIYVRPHAQKTNAFQSNRNILLSEGATLNTKPQLEIWADDVKCSHGCTSGQLDEEALFYLQTRGIPKGKAQAMLLNAFAGEVIGHVTIADVRHYLEELINQKL